MRTSVEMASLSSLNRLFDLSGGFGVQKQDRKLNEKTLHWESGVEERMRGERVLAVRVTD